MKITTLPKDLDFDAESDINLFYYRKQSNIQKTKINLAKNTISFLKTGTKEVVGNDETVKIDKQFFLIMKAGNCLMTEKVSNQDQVYESRLLFFSDASAIDFLERNPMSEHDKPDNKSFYTFRYDPFIKQFADSLEQVNKLPTSIQSNIMRLKFEEIMMYLTHQYGSSFLHSLVQKVDDNTSRMIKVVENNRFERLKLDELAFLSRMSISTFKRCFFDEYKMTPMKWFSDARLNHAALLLKTNQKRPIDLYEEAGYENLSNFTQAFKNKFGLTPKQYQKSI